MTTRAAIPPLAALLLVASGACSNKDAPPTASATATPSVSTSGRPLPSPMPLVAARINDQDLATRSVAVYARSLIRRKQFADDQKPEALREALERLIDRELLFQEAMRRGLSADPASLNAAYDEARVNHREDAPWAAFLHEQGTDDVSFRNELRYQKTVEALVRQEAGKAGAAVSDADVRAFFDAHKEGYPAGFESSKDVIKGTLVQERQTRALDELLASLKAKARIERMF